MDNGILIQKKSASEIIYDVRVFLSSLITYFNILLVQLELLALI